MYHMSVSCVVPPECLPAVAECGLVDEIGGKLGQICTDFEVKHRKSARIIGIDHSKPGNTAPHLGYHHGMVSIHLLARALVKKTGLPLGGERRKQCGVSRFPRASSPWATNMTAME